MTYPFKEIIEKEQVTPEEMRVVVEAYIKEKKGKEVKIGLVYDGGQFDLRELTLLNNAYDYALAHFKK